MFQLSIELQTERSERAQSENFSEQVSERMCVFHRESPAKYFIYEFAHL